MGSRSRRKRVLGPNHQQAATAASAKSSPQLPLISRNDPRNPEIRDDLKASASLGRDNVSKEGRRSVAQTVNLSNTSTVSRRTIPARLPNPPRAGDVYQDEEIIAIVLMRERAGVPKMRINVDTTRAASSLYYPVNQRDFAMIRNKHAVGSAYSREIRNKPDGERTYSKITEMYGYEKVRKVQLMLEVRGFVTNALPNDSTAGSSEGGGDSSTSSTGQGNARREMYDRHRRLGTQKAAEASGSRLEGLRKFSDSTGMKSGDNSTTRARGFDLSRVSGLLSRTQQTLVEEDGLQRLQGRDIVTSEKKANSGIISHVSQKSRESGQSTSTEWKLECFKTLREQCILADNGDPNGELTQLLLEGVNPLLLNPDISVEDVDDDFDFYPGIDVEKLQEQFMKENKALNTNLIQQLQPASQAQEFDMSLALVDPRLLGNAEINWDERE